MEENIKIFGLQKQKTQIVVDNTYIFNFDMKNNTIKYRCKNYRHHQPRCPAYLVLDKNNNIIKKINFHLCKGNKTKIEIKEARETIKKEISNASNELELKPKNLFNNYTETHPNAKIFFSNIKSSLYNTINEEIPKDVESFEDLPEDSVYYYMQNGEKFVFYKDEEIFLMQTKLMAKIMHRFSKEVFMDVTFFLHLNSVISW